MCPIILLEEREDRGRTSINIDPIDPSLLVGTEPRRGEEKPAAAEVSPLTGVNMTSENI